VDPVVETQESIIIPSFHVIKAENEGNERFANLVIVRIWNQLQFLAQLGVEFSNLKGNFEIPLHACWWFFADNAGKCVLEGNEPTIQTPVGLSRGGNNLDRVVGLNCANQTPSARSDFGEADKDEIADLLFERNLLGIRSFVRGCRRP